MRYALGPVLIIVLVLLLMWGCSSLQDRSNDDPGYGNEGCPYVGPGGC